MFFFSFCLFSILFSFFVISVKNPVHSVLFLILTFLFCSIILFSFELEFIPLMFIIIYVGAVVILFLFVVMMLDIKISRKDDSFFKYFAMYGFIGFTFLIEILFCFKKNFIFYENSFFEKNFLFFLTVDCFDNLKEIGVLLYTKFSIFFLLAGLALLVAMFGAIALTLTYLKINKEQKNFRQLSKNSTSSTFLTKLL